VLLDALDALAAFPLPVERLPQLPEQLARLNELWQRLPPPEARGLRGRLPATVWEAIAPVLDRQRDFNSLVVQVVNGQIEESARLHAHLREVVGTLVRFLQRVLPLVDARDRVATGLAGTRAELILEAFDRRQESLGRRVDGLAALRDRLEVLSAEIRALQPAAEPGAAMAPRLTAPPPQDAADAAFAARFRPVDETLRERLADYAARFAAAGPVADLGCGRGEFLDALKQRGIAGRGVESNAVLVAECLARGLDVTAGDLIDFLAGCAPASLGGVFAAQVAEHLPPAALQRMLREAHRALRPGGLLVIETVNPRSLVGFLEVYNRDLTHERPLHPDTLSFLSAAAGFTDVRVELLSPVEPAARLQAVPADGLPARVAEILNENSERLNGIIYGPKEYALIARR
jgi:O-antigen chain-terminating methyltransferase